MLLTCKANILSYRGYGFKTIDPLMSLITTLRSGWFGSIPFSQFGTIENW